MRKRVLSPNIYKNIITFRYFKDRIDAKLRNKMQILRCKNYFDNAIASIIKYFFIKLQLYNNEIAKLNINLIISRRTSVCTIINKYVIKK